MKRARASGLSLIELIISMLLASLVLASLSSILTPLLMAQAYSARSQTVQLNLAAVDQLVERELRQASLVTMPSLPGMPSGALAGCANAAGSPPAPIDSAAPMRWFAFCSAAGIVYYHTGPGCPAVYACATAPTASFTWGPAPFSALTFIRQSASSTLVTLNIKASSGGTSAEVSGAVAFSAPAGGAQ